jgi:hypothetical protein
LLPYSSAPAHSAEPLRPPAVPLVTHDPYFSVWSMNDKLTDDWTKHWTGATQGLCGLVRIDGKPYRYLGPAPKEVPAVQQLSLEVTPTRTLYQMEAGGMRLTLTFTSPLLVDDLEVLSRPVTYLTWEAKSTDDKPHSVSVYLDVAAQITVNTPDQPVLWSRYKVGDLSVLRAGSKDQSVLSRSGDNLRIDWGYFYLAVPHQGTGETVLASDRAAREAFTQSGQLPDADDLRMPRPANDAWPVLACTFDLEKVTATPVARHVLLAYDDGFSIEYFHRKLRPYWRRKGMEVEELLRNVACEYATLTRRCQDFDRELTEDLRKSGGEPYARLATLAYRQCIAAHKLVADFDGTPLLFSKENFSNGCIDTVDVTYPSSPFFLLLNPQLLKAQLVPVMDYARSVRWPHAFAPHDLGTYPLANGQVYGGGEKTEQDQMPVEECGNMLLMVAALARAEGNPDFAVKYWPVLTKWAQYLRDKGLDPEHQLCTDDFAGHLAHNTNLSLKAILALGGYAQLCDQAGKKEEAVSYRKAAQEMADKWVRMADDGDHYRLAFDKPDTWSQKYNLVWDKLLGLNLFPATVAQKEIAYYKAKQNEFGLPLDNRSTYTKLDWIVWTATLADSREDFEALIAPVYRFIQQSPSRVPLTDWYWTQDAKQRGFQARSVVGGVYIKMLADPTLAKKWQTKAAEKR